MPGQVPEQIAAQVAGHGNEGVAGNPACNAPQEVVGRNQCRKQRETEPRVFGMGGKPGGERVHQDLHAILGTDRASDRRDDSGEDGGMRERPPSDVAGEKRKGTIAVPTSVLHCGRNSPNRRDARATEFLQRKNRLSGSLGTRPDGRAARKGGKLPEEQAQGSSSIMLASAKAQPWVASDR